jgi:hypothetical protein
MKHIILRIAGTFGSGKTTAMRHFLEYPSSVLNSSANKIMGYKVDVPDLKAPAFIVGKYDNICGGTDSIKTQDDVAERILKAHKYGHVLYEGALVSASGLGGAVTQAVHPTGCDVYAFLDTPLEVCIERVLGRRAAAGNDKEFNPKNLEQKYTAVIGCYRNLRAAGYNVHLVNHKDPHPQLLSIIGEFENA